MDEFKGRVEAFAIRLQKAIDIKNMKKAELSRLTGISQQRLGQYVRKNYEARQFAVCVIAEALGVNPAWLAGYDVSMDPPADEEVEKSGKKVSDNDLKLALFGTTEVSDELLEDVKKMAQVHFELRKKEKCRLKSPKPSMARL